MRCTLLVLLAFATAATAQQTPSTTPPPPGADISARDGDRIIVDNDARIQIVRRRQAIIRTIFSQKERLLIVLVDYSKPGEFPDGMVDLAFNFYEVDGPWPLGPRWEGLTTMFQHQGDARRQTGLAFETPRGLVLLVPSGQNVTSQYPSALAVLTHGASSSGPRRGVSFAEAEKIQLHDFVRSKASGATVGTTMPAAGSRVTGTAVVKGQILGPNSTPQTIPNIEPSYPLPQGALPAEATVRTPPPVGQEIAASDGDRIMVDDDARIQIVRQRQGTIRAIFNQEQRLLMLLVDEAKLGELPDGQVDAMFNFYDVEGPWPLEPRWEASTTMFQYESDQPTPRGYGLTTPQGLVHLFPARPGTGKPESSATAVVFFRGLTGGGRRGLSFAEAEHVQLSEAAKRKSTQ